MRSGQKKKKLIIAITGAVIASYTVFSSLNTQIELINRLSDKVNQQNKIIKDLKNQPSSSITQESSSNKIVVAKGDIKLGTKLTLDMLETRDLKENESASDGYNDLNALIGQTVSSDIKAGESVLKSKVLNDQTSNFDIPTGMRAITIPVEYMQGLASYISVGSKVDIISTVKDKDTRPPIVVQNVRIISLETNGLSILEEAKANKATAVTLEVPAVSIQRLVEAMVSGKLQIVTRGYQDDKIITGASNPAKLRYNSSYSNESYKLPSPPMNITPVGPSNISALPEPAMPVQKTNSKSVEMIQANVKSEVTFDKD